MKNEIVLNILNRIKDCLLEDEWAMAKEYAELEIQNLKGITEQECKQYKSCYDWYCKECKNLNCNKNSNI